MYVIRLAEMILAGLDQLLLNSSQKRIFTDVLFFFQHIQGFH